MLPGVAAFWVVYPGTLFPAAALRKHRDDWLPGCAALCDPDLRLTRTFGVRVTPEAAVITPARGLVLMEQGQLGAAAREFEKALRLNPADDLARSSLEEIAAAKRARKKD